MAINNEEVSGQVILNAGVSYKKLMLGVGSGIDWYGLRSVPIFVEGRFNFSGKLDKVFIYTKLGVNLNKLTAKQQYEQTEYTSTGFARGIYTDFGLGYSLYNSHLRGVQFGLGYSVKTLKQYVADIIYPTYPIYNQTGHYYTYTFNRYMVSVGYRF
ncbi:hypothetical protein KXQ82_16855 [Mucilaginibacter sp. HMF5004]|uniref:hypothetical protein n=1 Tax=Mucilaginibacter rivuli TaxID=2857527 RepID=UPI001C5E8A58|nr:hypothetical protein [Mucilaginibacter rivuli]MBW4891400.1 hypothetical protein [Mucilaginibacter rivuli]